MSIFSSLCLPGESQSAGSGSRAWPLGLGRPAAGERSRRDLAPPTGASHGLVFVLHVCLIFIIVLPQSFCMLYFYFSLFCMFFVFFLLIDCLCNLEFVIFLTSKALTIPLPPSPPPFFCFTSTSVRPTCRMGRRPFTWRRR